MILRFFKGRKLLTEEEVSEFYDEWLILLGITVDGDPLSILSLATELWNRGIYITTRLFEYILNEVPRKKFLKALRDENYGSGLREITSAGMLSELIGIDETQELPYMKNLKYPKIEEGSEILYYEQGATKLNNIAERNRAHCLKFFLIPTEYLTEKGAVVLQYDTDMMDALLHFIISLNDNDLRTWIDEEMVQIAIRLDSFLYLSRSELKRK